MSQLELNLALSSSKLMENSQASDFGYCWTRTIKSIEISIWFLNCGNNLIFKANEISNLIDKYLVLIACKC